MLSESAPGPIMTIEALLIFICPEINRIVSGYVNPENMIVSFPEALFMASRKDPGPESLVLITNKVC